MFESRVRHMIVAKLYGTTEPVNEGDIQLVKTPDGKKIYFRFVDKGGLESSDAIEIDKIRRINVSQPTGIPLHKYVVKVDPSHLDTDAANAGNMIPGETYGLRCMIRNWCGIDYNRFKDAYVLGRKGMNPYDFYVKMKEEFEKQFTAMNDRDIFTCAVANTFTVGGITIKVKKDGMKVAVDITGTATQEDISTDSSTGVTTIKCATTSTLANLKAATGYDASVMEITAIGTIAAATAVDVSTSLVITDCAPKYKQEIIKMVPTDAEITTDTINENSGSMYDKSMVNWGTVTKSVDSYTGNARATAEAERFSLRARGEEAGYIGFPFCDPAEMMIQNPAVNGNYVYLNIEYLFRGEGIVNTDSPKNLTIVCEATTDAAAVFDSNIATLMPKYTSGPKESVKTASDFTASYLLKAICDNTGKSITVVSHD